MDFRTSPLDRRRIKDTRTLDCVLSDFNAWFQGSKIVDSAGNPLRLFHGSRPHAPEITTFHTPQGDGAYFTPDPQYAEGFTNDITGKLHGSFGAMYPVYLSIKKPYVVYTKDQSPAYLNFIERGLDTEELKRKGFDGAMLFVDGFGLDQVIAFYPQQIRSAISQRPRTEHSRPESPFQGGYHDF